MNRLSEIIHLGTNRQSDPVYNKHIRFANAVTLITCGFIFPNTALAFLHGETGIAIVHIVHFILMMFVFVFNARGFRVLASCWWSMVAITAVTYYGIIFTEAGLNWTFLPIVLFLQFFLFSSSEKWAIILFSTVTLLGYILAQMAFQTGWNPMGIVSVELIQAQRINSIAGLPILSLAFGMYAYSTINRAEKEAANERHKTENLLLNILPKPVAERFRHDQSVLAQGYKSVSVLFADIVAFTSFSEKTSPEKLLHFLNDVFSEFDRLTEKYDLEKIKTIGDAYMVAGGVPEPCSDHLVRICNMAIDMRDVASTFKTPAGDPLHIRIGISTGPVTAGVIGSKKFIYDLWGDTVNTASRMESHSVPGQIHITSDVHALVGEEFECMERGFIQVKGKGEMRTYFLVGRKM